MKRRRPAANKISHNVFDKFDEAKSKEVKKDEPKPVKEPVKKEETVTEKRDYVSITELTGRKKSNDDVFKKLSSIAQQSKGKKEETKEKPVKTKTETKTVYLQPKEDPKKIKSRLDKVERKLEKISKPMPVYSTKSGSRYHKADCITLKGKKGLRKHSDNTAATKKKLKPCNVCMSKK